MVDFPNRKPTTAAVKIVQKTFPLLIFMCTAIIDKVNICIFVFIILSTRIGMGTETYELSKKLAYYL